MVSLKEFYENGRAKNETDFSEGIYKEYFKSGAIKIDARFKDKKPHGLIKEYYEEGILAAEDGYDHGRHVGSRRYSRLGSLVASSGKLKEAEPVVFETKKEEGNMFKEYIDKLGQMPEEEKKPQVAPIVQDIKPEIKEEPKQEIIEKPVEEKTAEPAAQKVPATSFDSLREALVEEKKGDKNIDFVRNEIEKALEGKLENEIQEVGREPQVEEKGDEKTVKEYYLSGALKIERIYVGDKLHGLTKEYYESGELMAEQFYVDGELDNQTRFDKNGKFFYKWKR
jgi:antitoxin component YwqK of YwqJK toxin-antitoxin module